MGGSFQVPGIISRVSGHYTGLDLHPWQLEFAHVRLTKDVYLVGGGNLAFNLSYEADCHIYAITSQDQIALVDSGLGPGTEQVLENMRADGLDPRKLKQIFVTHYHADHAAALNRWRTLTGATICASRLSAPAIKAGDAETIGLVAAKRAGYYPVDFQLEACAVDVEFDEGEQFEIGNLKLLPYATPGHSQDHFSFLLKGGDRDYLFSGDSLFWGGTIILQNIPDCNLQACTATIERLAKLSFEALLPGHLAISLKNGKRHAEAALKTIQGLGIPKNAV
jgi:hydroxyacylglutathione hydrolase